MESLKSYFVNLCPCPSRQKKKKQNFHGDASVQEHTDASVRRQMGRVDNARNILLNTENVSVCLHFICTFRGCFMLTPPESCCSYRHIQLLFAKQSRARSPRGDSPLFCNIKPSKRSVQHNKRAWFWIAVGGRRTERETERGERDLMHACILTGMHGDTHGGTLAEQHKPESCTQTDAHTPACFARTLPGSTSLSARQTIPSHV